MVVRLFYSPSLLIRFGFGYIIVLILLPAFECNAYPAVSAHGTCRFGSGTRGRKESTACGRLRFAWPTSKIYVLQCLTTSLVHAPRSSLKSRVYSRQVLGRTVHTLLSSNMGWIRRRPKCCCSAKTTAVCWSTSRFQTVPPVAVQTNSRPE